MDSVGNSDLLGVLVPQVQVFRSMNEHCGEDKLFRLRLPVQWIMLSDLKYSQSICLATISCHSKDVNIAKMLRRIGLQTPQKLARTLVLHTCFEIGE